MQQILILCADSPHQSAAPPAGGELPRRGKRDHPGVSPQGRSHILNRHFAVTRVSNGLFRHTEIPRSDCCGGFCCLLAAGARPRPTMLISVGLVNVGQGRAPAVCWFTADGDVTCGTGRPIPYEYFLDFAFYCYCIPFNRGIPRDARNDKYLDFIVVLFCTALPTCHCEEQSDVAISAAE